MFEQVLRVFKETTVLSSYSYDNTPLNDTLPCRSRSNSSQIRSRIVPIFHGLWWQTVRNINQPLNLNRSIESLYVGVNKRLYRFCNFLSVLVEFFSSDKRPSVLCSHESVNFVKPHRSKQHRRHTSNVAIEWNFLEIAIKRSIHRINSLTDSLAGLFSFSYHVHAANRSFPLKLRRYPLELSPRTGHSYEILEWRSNSVYIASSKGKRIFSAISTICLNLSLWIEQEAKRWMLRDWSGKIPFDCFWKINLLIRDWFLTERKYPDPYRCSQILVDLIVGCSSFSLARWQRYILIFHDILCDISSPRSLFFFLSSLFSKTLFQCRVTS